MSKKSILTTFISVLLILLLIFVTWKFDVSYYLTSTLMVIISMIPMYFDFEHKRPEARELVVISILCALTVASRVLFSAFPFFKPTFAIIIIAGFAFGPQVGFLTGSLSAFVSNLYFSQGVWTPWQMLAWGIAGLLAGIVSKTGIVTGKNRITASIFGFISTVLISGPILDTCTLFTMTSSVNMKNAVAVYSAGLTVNIYLAIATALTLFLLTGPLIKKLDRVKIKYNIFKE